MKLPEFEDVPACKADPINGAHDFTAITTDVIFCTRCGGSVQFNQLVSEPDKT